MTLTEILVGIAGDGLSPSLRPLLEQPLDPESWSAFIAKLDQLMLSTFALAACEQGTLAVTESQFEELRTRATEATGRCRTAAESLEEIVTTLDRHGLDALRAPRCGDFSTRLPRDPSPALRVRSTSLWTTHITTRPSTSYGPLGSSGRQACIPGPPAPRRLAPDEQWGGGRPLPGDHARPLRWCHRIERSVGEPGLVHSADLSRRSRPQRLAQRSG